MYIYIYMGEREGERGVTFASMSTSLASLDDDDDDDEDEEEEEELLPLLPAAVCLTYNNMHKYEKQRNTETQREIMRDDSICTFKG